MATSLHSSHHKQNRARSIFIRLLANHSLRASSCLAGNHGHLRYFYAAVIKL